jgi:hypothetical protein
MDLMRPPLSFAQGNEEPATTGQAGRSLDFYLEFFHLWDQNPRPVGVACAGPSGAGE